MSKPVAAADLRCLRRATEERRRRAVAFVTSRPAASAGSAPAPGTAGVPLLAHLVRTLGRR
jgi:hypothetical protein